MSSRGGTNVLETVVIEEQTLDRSTGSDVFSRLFTSVINSFHSIVKNRLQLYS